MPAWRDFRAAPPSDEPLPSPLLDAHVHLMPDRLFRAVREYFDRFWTSALAAYARAIEEFPDEERP